MADDILKVGIDATDGVEGAAKVKQALTGMVAEAKRAEDQVRKTGKSVDETGGIFKKFGISGRDVVGVLGGLGIATTGAAAIMKLRQALISSTHAALDFSKSMAEVSTLLPDTEGMAALGDEVRRLSMEFNQAPTDQARALYQVISAGATDAAEAVELLEVANRLAVGGVTSVSVAADGLTSILNAYGLAVGDAVNVSDALFVAMRAGKTTIGELSSALGRVAPLAAQAGVSIDELAAAVAALTKGGISTDIAITGLRAIIAAVVKPTSEAVTMANELGIEFNSAALEAKGLAGFMGDLVSATGGSTDAMAQLFGGVEALVPALALAGQAGVDLNATLDQMTEKAGATGEAFSRVAESDAFRFEQSMKRMKDASIDVGDAILQGILPPLELLAQHIDEVILTGKLLGRALSWNWVGWGDDIRNYAAANRDAAAASRETADAFAEKKRALADLTAEQFAATKAQIEYNLAQRGAAMREGLGGRDPDEYRRQVALMEEERALLAELHRIEREYLAAQQASGQQAEANLKTLRDTTAAAAEAARVAREAAEAKAFQEALRYADELLAAREVNLRHEQDTIIVLIEQRDIMAEIAANESRALADRIAARKRELELAEAVAEATAGGTGAMQFQPGTVPTLGTEPVTPNLTPLNTELEALGLTFEDVLGAVEPLLGGFASLADALGLLDARAARAVRGVSDIATGATNMAAGNVVGGGAQLVGGLIQLGTSLFGASEEQKRALLEHQTRLQENTQRLFEMTQALKGEGTTVEQYGQGQLVAEGLQRILDAMGKGPAYDRTLPHKLLGEALPEPVGD